VPTDELDLVQLGALLRKAREASTWQSLDALAKQLGTTRQVIMGWEHGKHRPSNRHAISLSSLLGVPYDTIRPASVQPRPSDLSVYERLDEIEDDVAMLKRALEVLGRPGRRSEDDRHAEMMSLVDEAEERARAFRARREQLPQPRAPRSGGRGPSQAGDASS
jgi:transcriptional regulator with XRE-family HTH domain